MPVQWLPADAPPRLRPNRRGDLDMFGRTSGQLEAEAPPAPPPLRAHSAPAPGVGELHGLLVAELHSALEQEHARVREQRDGVAAQRDLRFWRSARSFARELLLRCLVGWFVHRHAAPRCF